MRGRTTALLGDARARLMASAAQAVRAPVRRGDAIRREQAVEPGRSPGTAACAGAQAVTASPSSEASHSSSEPSETPSNRMVDR